MEAVYAKRYVKTLQKHKRMKLHEDNALPSCRTLVTKTQQALVTKIQDGRYWCDDFTLTLVVHTYLPALKVYLIAQYLKLRFREQFGYQIWQLKFDSWSPAWKSYVHWWLYLARCNVPLCSITKVWILMVTHTIEMFFFFHPLNDL